MIEGYPSEEMKKSIIFQSTSLLLAFITTVIIAYLMLRIGRQNTFSAAGTIQDERSNKSKMDLFLKAQKEDDEYVARRLEGILEHEESSMTQTDADTSI